MLRLAFLNIQSLNNKLYDLRGVCQKHSIQVICLCETWNGENSAWIGRLLLDEFQVVERARPRPQGDGDHLTTNHGGVAICTTPGIRLSKMKLSRQFQTFELVITNVSSGELCALVVVYRPGSAGIT